VNGRSKLALAHDTLSLTCAAFDEVPRLTVTFRRQEACHFMDAADVVLGDGIDRSLAGSRTDANPNAHKIANLEPRLGHVRSIDVD
jgi:hypothetical protein